MIYQVIFLLCTGWAAGVKAIVIDLSHNHGPDTIMSPHVPHFNRSTIFAGDYIPGVYVEGGQYFSGEHGGTHMDAPVHFQRGGKRIHEIPIENTIAEGVMLDFSKEAAKDNAYIVPLEKILEWEKTYGEIPMRAAVIFNFGWSSKFSDKKLYLGSDVDDQFTYVFPSVSGEAGNWLFNKRDIKIIGTDTLTPDPFNIHGQKITSFPIHQKYLPNSRLIIENLSGTEQLPPVGFRFHASPVKYLGATGTQVRAYAMTYDEVYKSGTTALQSGHRCMFVVLFIISIVTSFGIN